MKYRLELINKNMGEDVFLMYQDIPSEELGSINKIKNCSLEQFYRILAEFKKEETIINPKLNTTTNRYIFFVNNEPLGELGIRTTLNEKWLNKGSQIFYKIRLSKRNQGYGTKMLELALEECKKLGMKKVRINCDDSNIASKRVIEKNGGKIDIKSYKTLVGFSSSYIIDIM